MRERFIVSHEFDSHLHYLDFIEDLGELRRVIRTLHPKARIFQKLITFNPIGEKTLYEARLTFYSPTSETLEKAKDEFGNLLKKYKIKPKKPD